MIKRIELLVHAGAPSARKDDDRYRAQAEAYLTFRGQKIQPERNEISADHRVFAPANQSQSNQGDRDNNDEIAMAGVPKTVYLDDTQLAYTALDSQLLTSSLVIPPDLSPIGIDAATESDPRAPDRDTALLNGLPTSGIIRVHSQGSLDVAQPKKRPLDEDKQRATTTENSHQDHCLGGAVAREPSDEQSQRTRSSYLRSPVLERPTKRPRTSEGLQSVVQRGQRDASAYVPLLENSHIGLAYVGSQGQHHVETTANADAAPSQGSIEPEQSTSELPTTYSLSNITSKSSKQRPSVSQRSASNPGPRTRSHDSDSTEVSGAEPNKTIVVRDTAVPELAPIPAQPDIPPPPLLNPLANLSTAIQPPLAPVALDKYTTHVTRGLQGLADNPDLAPCFRPISTSRLLRPLERGHWLIRCPTNDIKWTAEKQANFWKWLETYIGNGSAGWGTWITREVAEDDPNSLGTIQVFCWGEVVKHVYHMLYVASSAQVRRLGLQWVDGGGEVVVQMKSA